MINLSAVYPQGLEASGFSYLAIKSDVDTNGLKLTLESEKPKDHSIKDVKDPDTLIKEIINGRIKLEIVNTGNKTR